MRCRICGANDREALIEQLMDEMWASQGDIADWGTLEQAGPYWQPIMRQFAEATLRLFERPPSQR
jgi:hypothetical protein